MPRLAQARKPIADITTRSGRIAVARIKLALKIIDEIRRRQ
jgi:hypothetical protein